MQGDYSEKNSAEIKDIEWMTKILCIGRYKKPSNAFLRTLSFETLGCAVERIDLDFNFSSPNIFFRILRRVIFQPIRIKYLVKKIGKKIIDFDPQIVFVEKGNDFNSHDLKFFKASMSSKSKIVHLNPDDPFGAFTKGWKKFVSSISYYDVHFVPKELNKGDYLKLSAKNVFVYDRSFEPNYHKPITLTESEKQHFACDIGFIGTYAEQRESFLNALVAKDFKILIWGDGWSKGRHWSRLKHYWRGGTQTGTDYIKAINGMKIALHFVRHENRDLQDSRTFEIPACGSFMLAERTSDHERLFTENKEAVFFESVGDCIAKCEYYLDNPLERKKIADAGLRRALISNYNYTSRSKEFLKIIERVKKID